MDLAVQALWCLVLFSVFSVPGLQAQNLLEIVFTRTPPRVTSQTSAAFAFVLKNASGQEFCKHCSIQCRLDEAPFQDCSSGGDTYVSLENGQHTFEVSVGTFDAAISALYNWTVDFIPPTGSITVDREFTNALNTSLHIVLSEPCAGNGGFTCSDISNCDVVVHGPGTVVPSTLKVIRENQEYSLLLDFSSASLSGRVSVALAKRFCSDLAGNKFQRSENSNIIIRFDRNPVHVNLWTGITELQVVVNNQARTLQATSKLADLGIFLDFTKPIINSTEEMLNVLTVNAGVLQPTQRKSHGNRRFGFMVTNITKSTVVTVKLEAGLQSRDGTIVSPTSPISFLYDVLRPEVKLTTASPVKTRKHSLGIWIDFSEPVFLFDSSCITISIGNITRFKEVSKSSYFMELFTSSDDVVTVFVPENKTTDIAGNPNSASNRLQVSHYSAPASAVASSSFITAGLLATFVASGVLSISSTSLAAAGALTSRTAGSIVSNPSGNLLGMAGHLQVFALSYYASTDFPLEYRETVRGIQWLIPHVNLSWQKQHDILDTKFKFQAKTPYTLDYYQQTRRNAYRRRLGSNTTLYGPALDAGEYKLFFQNEKSRRQPLDQLGKKYTGWDNFGKNMFWLGVVGGGFLLLHLLLLAFLRWRTQASLKGGLCFPRFELFALILALPCICQASSFIIRGGTTGGIIVGVLLLAVPTAFFLSVLMFLLVAIIWGALVQYKEYRSDTGKHPWHGVLLSTLFGDNNIGKWVRKEGVSSSFLPKFGLLFENRQGPPNVVYVDEDYASKWVDSEGKGIGRMKPVNSDEESVDMTVSRAHKLLGAARILYILVDIARRIAFGIIFGAYPVTDGSWSQLSIVFALTLGQLVYLVSSKPYIRRGVQLVESVSLLCEMGVFAAGLGLLAHGYSSENRRGLGIFMVTLVLISFMCQLINEWYALMEQLLKLSEPQEPSFKVGMKMLGKGLLFPFIPQRRWPKFITPPQQPKIGLVPVVHSSPSPDFQRSKILPAGSPISMTETGGPVYDPGSPSLVDPRTLQQQRTPSGRHQSGPLQRPDKQVWSQWTRSVSFEGKKARVARSDSSSNELKTLRELARASFPGTKKDDNPSEIGGTVQTAGMLLPSDEIRPGLSPATMEVISLDYNAPSLSSH